MEAAKVNIPHGKAKVQMDSLMNSTKYLKKKKY
jgi:hypothetical protein